MNKPTQGSDTQARFFRTQRPGDPRAELAQRKRDIDHELFSPWADENFIVDDLELEITAIQEATGEGKATVEKAIFAYRRLSDLPWLRAIQDATRVLDLKRLTTVDNVIAELGPDLSSEVLGAIDEFLAAMFTPRKANQPLLTPKAITHRLRRFIAKLDEDVSFDPRKRKRRTDDHGDFRVTDFTGAAQSGFLIDCDEVTHALIRAYRERVAREYKTTEDEAARLILTGCIGEVPAFTIYGYAPVAPDGNRVPGSSIYFPGTGWTRSEGTAQFDALTEQQPPRIVDLDEVATHRVAGYVPSTNMKAYAVARDGTCVWPGCTQPAQRCQLDHRVPFAEGGETTPSNLFSLCQRHHNVKTDHRAYYVQDPATGDIIWLFADGTYALSEPEGFIGEQLNRTHPRWNTDLDKRRQHRDASATFFARGHKILDEFELSNDFASCIEALEALEAEFKMDFPFKPKPKDDYDVWVEELIAKDPYLEYGDAIY